MKPHPGGGKYDEPRQRLTGSAEPAGGDHMLVMLLRPDHLVRPPRVGHHMSGGCVSGKSTGCSQLQAPRMRFCSTLACTLLVLG